MERIQDLDKQARNSESDELWRQGKRRLKLHHLSRAIAGAKAASASVGSKMAWEQLQMIPLESREYRLRVSKRPCLIQHGEAERVGVGSVWRFANGIKLCLI